MEQLPSGAKLAGEFVEGHAAGKAPSLASKLDAVRRGMERAAEAVFHGKDVEALREQIKKAQEDSKANAKQL